MAMPVRLPSPGAKGSATPLRGYVEALAMVAASTLIGLVMARRWGTSAVDLLYLPAVLGTAVVAGLRPALLAAVASALAYNYFFTAPHFTFRIRDADDVVTVAMLFLVAVVTSRLAGKMRDEARAAAAHAARNATIAGFARALLSCSSESQIGEIACRRVSELFGCNAALLTGHPVARLVSRCPEGTVLTPSDLAAAALTLDSGRPAGRGAMRLDPAEWSFFPIGTEAAVVAAIGLARDDGGQPVDDSQILLLENLLDQVALALERTRLEAGARDLAGLRERDRLRSALLSSVGHDLRTPLTAIMAGAADLRSRGLDGDGSVAAIGTEATKLERYISNLLDMARIEAGAVKVHSEPVDLVDAVAAALRDVEAGLGGRTLEVDVPIDLPLVRADARLLHHCLINLLDNAGRHSDAGSAIRVVAALEPDGVRLSIENDGRGLALPGPADLDRFRSISGSDRKGGAGLGLAIVKAFAEAMGAEASLCASPGGGGAAASLRFPLNLVLALGELSDGG